MDYKEIEFMFMDVVGCAPCRATANYDGELVIETLMKAVCSKDLCAFAETFQKAIKPSASSFKATYGIVLKSGYPKWHMTSSEYRMYETGFLEITFFGTEDFKLEKIFEEESSKVEEEPILIKEESNEDSHHFHFRTR